MKMVKSEIVEEAIKAFYAVSALIRNNLAGQQLFYAQAGDLMLQVMPSLKVRHFCLREWLDTHGFLYL